MGGVGGKKFFTHISARLSFPSARGAELLNPPPALRLPLNVPTTFSDAPSFYVNADTHTVEERKVVARCVTFKASESSETVQFAVLFFLLLFLLLFFSPPLH